MPSLPPIAPYPPASVRITIPPDTWATALSTYNTVLTLRLTLPTSDLLSDSTLHAFIATYFHEVSRTAPTHTPDAPSKQLQQTSFHLLHRILHITTPEKPPLELVQGPFLVSLAVALPKSTAVRATFDELWINHLNLLELSITNYKTTNVLPQLSSLGNNSSPTDIQSLLHNLSIFFLVSPHAGEIFIAGTDFLDALIELHHTQPSLRNASLRVAMAAFSALLPSRSPGNGKVSSKANYSLLFDHFYNLLSRKPGSPEYAFLTALISETIFLYQLHSVTPPKEEIKLRLASLISSLDKYTPHGDGRIPRPLYLKRKLATKDKGKARDDIKVEEDRLTRHILQVKELFPELREALVREKLVEFGGDVEAVIRAILDGEIYEETTPQVRRGSSILPPHPVIRKNIYDDDLESLSAPSSFYIGKKEKSVPEITRDSGAKQAILAALAAFDADDDERDDTYDVADIGGAVDTTRTELEQTLSGTLPSTVATKDQPDPEAILYMIWTTSTPEERSVLFARDSATRRGHQRADLKRKTGYSDERIEGWAIMLERDTSRQRLRELERKYGEGSREGGIVLNRGELARTRYRQTGHEEDGDDRGGASHSTNEWGEGRGRGGFRSDRGGGRGRGGRGSSGGNTGDTAKDRARKEHKKSSMANHHRKDGHARKMARGMGDAPG